VEHGLPRCWTVKNTGGELVAADGKITVKNADEVVLHISGRTSYWGDHETEKAAEDIRKIEQTGFEEIKTRTIFPITRHCLTGLIWP
jgi:hypothetical protein